MLIKSVGLILMLLYGLNSQAQEAEYGMLTDSSMYYYTSKNDLGKAVKFAEEALKVAEKLYGEHSLPYASTYILLAEAYFISRDFEKSLQYCQEHNRRLKNLIGKTLSDSLVINQLTMGLQDIASIYVECKKAEDAEDACRECIELNRDPGDKSPFHGSVFNYIACQKKLADTYFLNKKAAESIPVYKEVIQIQKNLYVTDTTRSKDNARELCAVLNNLGYVYGSMGIDYLSELALKEACFYGERSLPVGMDVYNDALVSLASTLAAMNQNEEAEVYFRKAEVINQQLNKDYKLAVLKGNMASMLPQLSLSQRKELRLQAVELLKGLHSLDHLADIEWGLAQDYILSGDYAEAEKYLKDACEITEKTGGRSDIPLFTALWALLAHGRGQKDEAVRLNHKSIMDSSVDDTDTYPKLWHNRAMIFTQYNRIGEADSAWATLLKVREERVQTVFPYLSEYQREGFLDVYDTSREQFLSFTRKEKTSASQNGQLFDLLLNSKGSLLEMLKRTRQDLNTTKDTSLLKKRERYNETRSLLARYSLSGQKGQTVDSLEAERETLEREISRSLPGKPRLRVKWQEVQSKLKPGEAAVEVVRFRLWDFERKPDSLWGGWSDSVYYMAMVLRSGTESPHMILLPNGRAMEDKYLQAYRDDIERRAYDADSYGAFWKPLREALADTKTVFFSPDGVYHQINLGTLINKETGRFLSEETDIHIVMSTRSLVDEHNLSKASKTISLFGFPNYKYAGSTKTKDALATISNYAPLDLGRGGDDFQPLPATKDEVESIGKITSVKGWTVKAFMEEQASEENLKSVQSPRVLHVATHGYFLKDTSKTGLTKQALLHSGLVLAGALDSTRRSNDLLEDGLLTAYEAATLHLEGTELVTLSACETGLGLLRNNNGVFGLQRAFLAAGAESVLMSLWRVNDRVTKQLMEKFYRYWMNGFTKQQALRKAQEEVRNSSEQLSHPYYWGGFVLTEQ